MTLKNPDTKNKDTTHAAPWFFVFFLFALTGGIIFLIWLIAPTEKKIGMNSPYERVIEKEQMQDQLGWGSELLIDKKKDQPAKIRLLLRDRNRKPISNAEVEITFTRPAGDGKPVTVPMGMDEAGVYRTAADLPLSGLWEARVAVRAGENTFQTSKRITLP
jgi:nitrogen fixation protein FixH